MRRSGRLNQGEIDTAYLGRMSSITRLGDDAGDGGVRALAAATATWVAFTVFGLALMGMIFPLRNRQFRELPLRGLA